MWPAGVVESFLPLDESTQRSALLALSISVNEQGGLHCGVAYRRSGDLRYLHLGWEDHLYQEPVPNDVLLSPSRLHEENQRIVGRLCNAIFKRHAANGSTFPWGYGFTNEPVFDASGEWRGEPQALTCATFVLAVFASATFRLISLDTWPLRPEDAAQAAALASRLPPAASAREVPRAGTTPRVRPEEAALAATAPEGLIPLSFSLVDASAQALRDRSLDQARVQMLASVRARFGAAVENAVAGGALASACRAGFPHIARPVTLEWARELTRDPSTQRRDAVLIELGVQLLRQLPPEVVSDDEIMRARSPELLTTLKRDICRRAGIADGTSLFEMVDLCRARGA